VLVYVYVMITVIISNVTFFSITMTSHPHFTDPVPFIWESRQRTLMHKLRKEALRALYHATTSDIAHSCRYEWRGSPAVWRALYRRPSSPFGYPIELPYFGVNPDGKELNRLRTALDTFAGAGRCLTGDLCVISMILYLERIVGLLVSFDEEASIPESLTRALRIAHDIARSRDLGELEVPHEPRPPEERILRANGGRDKWVHHRMYRSRGNE
jgi:hypothetical protein